MSFITVQLQRVGRDQPVIPLCRPPRDESAATHSIGYGMTSVAAVLSTHILFKFVDALGNPAINSERRKRHDPPSMDAEISLFWASRKIVHLPAFKQVAASSSVSISPSVPVLFLLRRVACNEFGLTKLADFIVSN